MKGTLNYDTVQVHNGWSSDVKSYVKDLVMSRCNKHTQLIYGTEILRIKWRVSQNSINRLVL
jgi:hypothetical protein